MKSFIGFILALLITFVYRFGVQTYHEYKAASIQDGKTVYECGDFLKAIKEYQWVQLNGCKVSFSEKIKQTEDIWGLNRTVYLFPIIDDKNKGKNKSDLFFRVSDLNIVKEYGPRYFETQKNTRDFFLKKFPYLSKGPIEGVISEYKEHKSGKVIFRYYTIAIGKKAEYPIASIGWILLYLLCSGTYFFKYY